jgi:hypothetical protein
MTPKLHRPLIPRARLNESHLPRGEPEEHLVPHPGLEARIHLDVHRKPDEEVYDVEREERVPSLFAMRGDHAIITAEIACGDAIHLELELITKIKVRIVHVRSPCLTYYFIDDSWPAACTVSRSMSTVSAEELVRAEPI